MNNNRRNKIKNIIAQLEMLLNEEQDCFDNMPENLQNSINGEDSETAIDNLEDAISLLEELI